MPIGGNLADGCRSTGISADQVRQAAALHESRWVQHGQVPGMTWHERQADADRCAINQSLPSVGFMFATLAGALDGPASDCHGSVTVETSTTHEGTLRKLVARGSKRLAKAFTEVPLLLTDATADPVELRHLFPRLEVLQAPPVSTPFAQTILIHGGGFGMRMTPHRAAQVRTLLQTAAIQEGYPNDVGIVTTKRHSESFRSLGSVLTHGSMAGSNELQDVRVLGIVGTTLPDPAGISKLASARAGHPIPLAQPIRGTTTLRTREGYAISVSSLRYENEHAEAARANVADRAIIQAVGRGRPVNRTSSNPLTTYVFGYGAPEGLTVDGIRDWKEVRKGHRLRCVFVEGGALYTAPEDAAYHHPGVFPTPRSAKDYRERLGGAAALEHRWRDLASRAPWPSVRCTYKLTGQGARERILFCPTSTVDQHRKALEKQHGSKLLWIKTEAWTPGREVSRPSISTICMPARPTSPTVPTSYPLKTPDTLSRSLPWHPDG